MLKKGSGRKGYFMAKGRDAIDAITGYIINLINLFYNYWI